MGRREITAGLLIAVLGAGVVASVAGLTTPKTNFTQVLIWGGLAAFLFAIAGLYGLWKSDPVATLLPASARVFLDAELTPTVLRGKTEGRTSLQIDALTKTYAGKWMTVSGRIIDITSLAYSLYMQIEAIDTENLTCTMGLSSQGNGRIN
jgi:hypothetical protein